MLSAFVLFDYVVLYFVVLIFVVQGKIDEVLSLIQNADPTGEMRPDSGEMLGLEGTCLLTLSPSAVKTQCLSQCQTFLHLVRSSHTLVNWILNF
jgi:hypothetical protein